MNTREFTEKQKLNSPKSELEARFEKRLKDSTLSIRNKEELNANRVKGYKYLLP